MSDYTVDTIVSDDGRTRVRIVIDTDASKPYDDGSSPVVRVEYRHHSTEQSGPDTSYKLHDGIVQAFARWASETDLAERYCRIFHGVTTFAYSYQSDRDAFYVTLDPTDWRTEVGAPAGSVDMTEWIAYVEGDCYGIVPERLTTWTNDRGETRETWDEIDGSVWGFYGQGDYLEASARDILADAMASS
jgi:hypothetical protein